MPRMARTANTGSLLHGGNGDHDEQEDHDHWEGDHDDHDENEDQESPRGADRENEDNEVDITMHGNCRPAIEDPPLTIKDKMQMMLLRLFLSQLKIS